MRNFFKITGSIATVALLNACAAKVSTSTSTATNSQTSSASSATTGANAVIAFSPASGTYNAMPTSITISLSNSSLDETSASNMSNYTLICGGSAAAASSVAYVPGMSSVTVTMPSTFIGLSEGEICTFAVSGNVHDNNGNTMSGTLAINYTYSASGAAPVNNGAVTGTGTTWVESSTVSYTSTIGNPVANYFQGVGATGVAMSGINVDGSTYVDGISGVWSNGFSSVSSATGPVQGDSTESFTALTCPAGMRMTGITGRSGSYIDAIGIICKSQDQTQSFTSTIFGGAGGTAYTLSCPTGQFVTNLDGTSGNYLDALYLGCR